MKKRGDTAEKENCGTEKLLRFQPFADAKTGRLNWPLPPPPRIEIKTEKGWRFIKTKKMLAITADTQYQWIHFINACNEAKTEKLMVREGMKHFDEWLFAFGFIRIHNSTIINILELERREGNVIYLTHQIGTELTISKSCEPLLEMALSIYRKP